MEQVSSLKAQGELAIQIEALWWQLLCVIQEFELYSAEEKEMMQALERWKQHWYLSGVSHYLTSIRKAYEKEGMLLNHSTIEKRG